MRHQPKQADDQTHLSPPLRHQNCGTLIPRSALQLFGTEQVLHRTRPFKVVIAGDITYLHSYNFFLFRLLSFWDVDIPNLIILINKAKQIKRNAAE